MLDIEFRRRGRGMHSVRLIKSPCLHNHHAAERMEGASLLDGAAAVGTEEDGQVHAALVLPGERLGRAGRDVELVFRDKQVDGVGAAAYLAAFEAVAVGLVVVSRALADGYIGGIGGSRMGLWNGLVV